MDAGTENIYCQYLLIYWSRLKKYKLSWGIDFFLQAQALLSKTFLNQIKKLHEALLLFVLIPILQKELN